MQSSKQHTPLAEEAQLKGHCSLHGPPCGVLWGVVRRKTAQNEAWDSVPMVCWGKPVLRQQCAPRHSSTPATNPREFDKLFGPEFNPLRLDGCVGYE
eukprot:240919-Amphidinium_carterae.1